MITGKTIAADLRVGGGSVLAAFNQTAAVASKVVNTLKKENKIFLICKEIQNRAVTK
jgi:hypothetical protein